MHSNRNSIAFFDRYRLSSLRPNPFLALHLQVVEAGVRSIRGFELIPEGIKKVDQLLLVEFELRLLDILGGRACCFQTCHSDVSSLLTAESYIFSIEESNNASTETAPVELTGAIEGVA